MIQAAPTKKPPPPLHFLVRIAADGKPSLIRPRPVPFAAATLILNALAQELKRGECLMTFSATRQGVKMLQDLVDRSMNNVERMRFAIVLGTTYGLKPEHLLKRAIETKKGFDWQQFLEDFEAAFPGKLAEIEANFAPTNHRGGEDGLSENS